ncbi:MAG: hypothetical protein H7A33_05790 [Deltaproteobacteria bacterium]|nr:hypothetical protein [Deltaproteobacteria bacterium]
MSNEQQANRITLCGKGMVHIQCGSTTLHFSQKDFVEFIKAGSQICHEIYALEESRIFKAG